MILLKLFMALTYVMGLFTAASPLLVATCLLGTVFSYLRQDADTSLVWLGGIAGLFVFGIGALAGAPIAVWRLVAEGILGAVVPEIVLKR